MSRHDKETDSFMKAALTLHTIKEDQNRLDLVHELQRMIFRNLIGCERRINLLKRARQRLTRKKSRERLSRDDSKIVKNLLSKIEERNEALRHSMFLWRCFGDGIAAIYQCKYSLKHLFYGEDYKVKEAPGFLTGKQGVVLEYKIFCLAIRRGIPAVLSDLTNIVRHGDVCLLGGPEPFPVEVKSSKNRNARSERQIAQLKELSEFYINDGAENFRGALNTKRVEQKHPEITYEDAINDCMRKATEKGIASISPEAGLHYIALTPETFNSMQSTFSDKASELLNPTMMTVQLTPHPNWLPVYPFTLSLRPDNLLNFIQQKIFVFVFLDMSVLKSHFKSHGICAKVMMDGTFALQICIDPTDLMKGVFRVSEQLFLRIACEFQSIKWFAQEYSTAFDNPQEILHSVTLDSPGVVSEIPREWSELRCIFESYKST